MEKKKKNFLKREAANKLLTDKKSDKTDKKKRSVKETREAMYGKDKDSAISKEKVKE